MKKYFLGTLAIFAMLALVISASGSTLARPSNGNPANEGPKGPPEKVEVCHYSEDEDKYISINISERALAAHLAHGDKLPGEFNPEGSNATATDNEDGTVTLAVFVSDHCGNGIADLNPTDDFYVMDSVIGGPFYFGTPSIPGSELNNWTFPEDGVYKVTLERNFFHSRPAGYTEGWYRIWDIFVHNELVEADLELHTTYYAVGDWELDLYIGTNPYPRFVNIISHSNGNIVGFMGVGYDSDGTPTGNITGTIVGQTINMHYDRVGYDDPTYTADLTGTIANDGNSMSGTWSDYARTNEPWSMVR